MNVWWLAYFVMACAMLIGLTDRRAKHCVTLYLIGVTLMQVWKVAGLGDWQWLASGATWVVIADATRRQSATFAGLTLLSAMCYAYGRVIGADFVPMIAPIVLADIFGVSGLLFVGGPGIANLARRADNAVRNRGRSRDAGMGGGAGRWINRRRCDMATTSQAKAGKQ